MTFEGNLTDDSGPSEEIAHKCPVHKTLTSEIVITDLKELRPQMNTDKKINITFADSELSVASGPITLDLFFAVV